MDAREMRSIGDSIAVLNPLTSHGQIVAVEKDASAKGVNRKLMMPVPWGHHGCSTAHRFDLAQFERDSALLCPAHDLRGNQWRKRSRRSGGMRGAF